jgi:hypothetical protein
MGGTRRQSCAIYRKTKYDVKPGPWHMSEKVGWHPHGHDGRREVSQLVCPLIDIGVAFRRRPASPYHKGLTGVIQAETPRRQPDTRFGRAAARTSSVCRDQRSSGLMFLSCPVRNGQRSM